MEWLTETLIIYYSQYEFFIIANFFKCYLIMKNTTKVYTIYEGKHDLVRILFWQLKPKSGSKTIAPAIDCTFLNDILWLLTKCNDVFYKSTYLTMRCNECKMPSLTFICSIWQVSCLTNMAHVYFFTSTLQYLTEQEESLQP